MNRFTPGRLVAWILVAGLVTAGCIPRLTNINVAPDLAKPPQAVIEALAKTLPTIADLQVTEWRNQDWCHNIVYVRGEFSDTTDHSTCDLFAGTPATFDDRAWADFDTISKTIGDTNLGAQSA